MDSLEALLRALKNLVRLISDGLPDEGDEALACWRSICNKGKEHVHTGPLAREWIQDIPSFPQLRVITEQLELRIQGQKRNSRERLIRRLREQRDENIKQSAGALYKEFRDPEQPPLTVLQRDDGTITGDVVEMDTLIRKAWLPIFAKHDGEKGAPLPDADRFFKRYGGYIECFPQHLQPISLDEVRRVIQRLDSDGAGGMDGWLPKELKLLPDRILELMLCLFDEIEDSGIWPAELCWAGISLIPKGEGGNPLDLRPITVTSCIYRVWAAARMAQCHLWQDKWIQPGQHGSRKQHSTSDALAKMTIAMETAMAEGKGISGVAVDLSKAFDNVPIEIVFRVVEELGIDTRLLRALRGMYASIQRRFKINGCVGEAFRSTNGILQGCPLSVMLLNALMAILHKVLTPVVDGESYVDDLTIFKHERGKLQQGLNLIARFMNDTGQAVNAKKTKAFGYGADPRLRYNGKELEYENQTYKIEEYPN